MNIAYLDPPYSDYFHRLASRLAERTGGEVLGLLSSSAYALYTRGDRCLVWPPGAIADPPPMPADSGHATWSQPVDERFRAVFWHTVAWFRQCFLEQGTDLCMVFSDARPFSLAAAVAARELGVRCLYFERGAYRYCTASLSVQGLNGRFSLQRARECPDITGVPERTVLRRRREEPRLRRNFVRFVLTNEVACIVAPDRRRLQHKRYAFGPYIRLAVVQWWAKWQHRMGMRFELEDEELTIVVPLQVPADSQLRLYSPFADNQSFLDFVVQHVRRVAPTAHVLVKRHPMDSTRYRMPAGAVAVSGNLTRFWGWRTIVVCVNSTVGFEAAARGMPVICFGDSFYSGAEPVARTDPYDFAACLAERIERLGDGPAGRRLRADVLRWYQSPGDVWAYTSDDLDRTTEIALQHYRAALSPVPQPSEPSRPARAAPAVEQRLEPVDQQSEA